ncbi:hypothetical protein SLEP1_g18169 [Rubroshorea leprosula]|uniref:Uncharacterized protein n=1 Tax=Rubroshorea leprosula TaxID=152421 RepID=A0AAV5J5K3_9ROSI|nr:hypothetical protein SLEP1_g18169 [Rubroshorea leprosula]
MVVVVALPVTVEVWHRRWKLRKTSVMVKRDFLPLSCLKNDPTIPQPKLLNPVLVGIFLQCHFFSF